MDDQTLRSKAAAVRLKVVEAIALAGKGHIGGALSCADILVALYFGGVLRVNPKDRFWEGRDRFILSKGHVGAILYVVLADLGFFPETELRKLNRGGMLGEHPDRSIPGVEIDSGSLGHGLGVGCGMALAAKLDGRDHMTFVLLGDGECYEGSTWEAAMFASHHCLSNLVAIVDRNRQCVSDYTENINKLEPLSRKWAAFGWDVREIDGHSFPELMAGFAHVRRRAGGQPLIVVANTVKGRGVSFMEGQISWHHGGIGSANLERARRELTDAMKAGGNAIV